MDTFKDLNIISTPHIGASTDEAQTKAGLDTVENIKKILAGDTTVAF
jgi:phosphoglycerate dehydrogenase-like enzyme